MTGILSLINWIILTLTSLFFLGLSLSSAREKEYRAAGIALIFFILNGLVWTGLLSAPDRFGVVNISLVCFIILFALISSLRFFPGRSPERDTSAAEPYDERDTMFARNNLQHHPDLMKTYYALRPENQSIDRQIHKKPEFGDRQQVYHEPYTAPCYAAAFEYLERSIPLSKGDPAQQKIPIDPVQFSRTLMEFATFYGACDVAVSTLLPHHFYSHAGRHASNWGHKTDQSHGTAISIVVPMQVSMMKKSPTSAVIQESARKYVEAAKISNILATYIRQFGYRAKAHNDANYTVLCVPIAIEAGLGELGRMGLLLHRVHGPCVRLATVTTDLELPPSPIKKPFHMAEFCKICKKCADNCPSGAIAHGDEPSSRQVQHWSIHQEKCFSYWKTIGSDCGHCISVCPYTKPDTWIHQCVRLYISQNSLNQRIALFMDDLLYGRYKKIARTNPEKIFTFS